MAVSSGFFNSINNDRLYNAEHFSKFFDGLITDGVYLQVGDKFHVDPGTGLAVNVGSGRGWFKRVWIYNDSTLELELSPADPILSRIDAIVIEVDASTNVRNADINVVTGTAATTPDKPTLIDEELNKQYPLAYVTVNPGATSLTNLNIEDCLASGEIPAVKALLDLDAEAIAEINERIAALATAFSGSDPGLVPRSTSEDQGKFLKGDGTWGTAEEASGDHQVFQNAAGNANSNLKVLLSNDNGSVNNYGPTKWDDDLRYNPSTNDLSVGSVNGVKLAKSGSSYGYYDANGNFKTFRQPTGNATAAQVRSGYTFSNASGDGISGTMADRGSLTATLYGPNDTYSYSAGYYSGGTITCKNYHDNNTYTLSASETGDVNLGTNHNYRKVNAANVYNAGTTAGYNRGVADAQAVTWYQDQIFRAVYQFGYSSASSPYDNGSWVSACYSMRNVIQVTPVVVRNYDIWDLGLWVIVQGWSNDGVTIVSGTESAPTLNGTFAASSYPYLLVMAKHTGEMAGVTKDLLVQYRFLCQAKQLR